MKKIYLNRNKDFAKNIATGIEPIYMEYINEKTISEFDDYVHQLEIIGSVPQECNSFPSHKEILISLSRLKKGDTVMVISKPINIKCMVKITSVDIFVFGSERCYKYAIELIKNNL